MRRRDNDREMGHETGREIGRQIGRQIDIVSLVTGGLFLVVAAVHIVASANDTDLNLHWTLPVLLLLIGAVGLLGALRSGGPKTSAEAADPDRVDDGSER